MVLVMLVVMVVRLIDYAATLPLFFLPAFVNQILTILHISHNSRILKIMHTSLKCVNIPNIIN